MPSQVPSISTERLISAGVYDLDPNLPLLASQVEVLLSRSKSRVETDRRDNKPPPSYLDGTKVLYPLGGVLDERARIQGKTRQQSREEAQQRVRQGGWSFSAFVGSGVLNDTWPIAIVRGQPVDFFATLAMGLGEDDLSDVAEMTLEEFLQCRLEALRRAESNRVAAALAEATRMPNGGNVPCQSCGRLAHSGPCRF